MKNQQLFNETVDILVNAYQKNTLRHGDCSACAVGNIIAAKSGITSNTSKSWRDCFGAEEYHTPYAWADVFSTDAIKTQRFDIIEYEGVAKKQIDVTGYSVYELASIELAFESADKGISTDDHMFNGLMSVVDALMIIHEASKEESEEAKSLFVKVSC